MLLFLTIQIYHFFIMYKNSLKIETDVFTSRDFKIFTEYLLIFTDFSEFTDISRYLLKIGFGRSSRFICSLHK